MTQEKIKKVREFKILSFTTILFTGYYAIFFFLQYLKGNKSNFTDNTIYFLPFSILFLSFLGIAIFSLIKGSRHIAFIALGLSLLFLMIYVDIFMWEHKLIPDYWIYCIGNLSGRTCDLPASSRTRYHHFIKWKKPSNIEGLYWEFFRMISKSSNFLEIDIMSLLNE